ncbi:MAG: helicase-exonuclease AddAB subunit AddA [Clostridia bacterium]|nr:helicase-exonuclease AddAB subunit AddA [Clostridia bacterium]
MARNWTEKQLDAIKARDGSVLVSAAAGSGKTAVLVERVIERLCDKEKPSSADRLLIVTFTRAAANEMRQRISKAIEDELKKNPDDSNLINQQILLQSAKICTIDSFCNSLVRDNFQLLDISPDFKNADEGQLSLLKAQAMQLTLEELYSQQDSDFFNLVELLFKGRDDGELSQMIYQLYNTSVSYPFPEKWLKEISESFSCGCEVSESNYGSIILSYICDALEFCLELCNMSLEAIEGCEELEKIFLNAVSSDKRKVIEILENARAKNWDETRQSIYSYEPEKRGRVSGELKDDSTCLRLIASRDKVKDIIRKNIGDLMCCDSYQFKEDMKYLSPMVAKLCQATKLFAENFSLLKRSKNLADFSDISQMAISLLVKESDNESGYEKTALATELSKNFDEILIDEYQDTNKAQDMLFESVSNNNLFRVGDVKQSIYRFRRAMPEIFISLKNAYDEYKREEKNYPCKIILGNNFRSRKSVTETVNFVFSQLMSESCGDIDYSEEEKLVCSASYSEKEDECSELHLLDISEIDKYEESSDDFQAKFIAQKINEMINSGFTVKDGETDRKATYKDFCILLRGLNGGRGAIYAKQLRQAGIPCFTEVATDFFSAYEVSLVLSLLRIIDNPRQDIALLTVMLSVIFGFDADDLAALRIENRKGDLYSCLVKAKANKKVSDFLSKINTWRNLSVSMGVEDFIRMIYEETAIDIIVTAMKGARTKSANLRLLLDYASNYEKNGFIGLSGFIGFVDRLERENQDLAGSVGVSSDADVVKIMSIHKSKGLEFPVCIVANCAGKFNRSDEKNNLIVSSKDGIGLILRQTETMAQYPTVSHDAVKLSVKKDTLSEEMRILYVAMTRAKEKLIMVSAIKNAEETLSKYASNINPFSKRTAPFAVSMASSYGEWLITALMRHKDASVLRNYGGLSSEAVIESNFRFRAEIHPWSPEEKNLQKEEEAPEIDLQFLKLIKERAEYKYKYEPLTYAVSKRAASEVDKGSVNREYFASSRPAFLSKDGLTAAQRGTATHNFMQFADYEKACQSVEEEIKRLTEKGFISETESKAIDAGAITEFFKSSLAKRILRSETVMREKKFTVRVPITQIYPELQEFSDETVVIQGIADCAFVENGKLVVVDYKTDHLYEEKQFIEKYKSQVEVYKEALTLCTDYEVEETYLYSFSLGKEIKVE